MTAPPLPPQMSNFPSNGPKTWAKSGFKSTVNKVKSVEVIDDYTVKIITPKPFGILHRKMAQIGIMNKAYVEKHGDEYQTDHPNGTGPYKLVEWVKGDHITLEANTEPFQRRTQNQDGHRPSADQ
jgi:peptide/nickel transport system substrate-binding protein